MPRSPEVQCYEGSHRLALRALSDACSVKALALVALCVLIATTGLAQCRRHPLCLCHLRSAVLAAVRGLNVFDAHKSPAYTYEATFARATCIKRAQSRVCHMYACAEMQCMQRSHAFRSPRTAEHTHSQSAPPASCARGAAATRNADPRKPGHADRLTAVLQLPPCTAGAHVCGAYAAPSGRAPRGHTATSPARHSNCTFCTAVPLRAACATPVNATVWPTRRLLTNVAPPLGHVMHTPT